ncbi:MAG: 4-hydroxy-tetrahydrodipicolinate synthase [Deltaproteobacteria bacterium]|nr:4-hydroxy-tetrahydrodipicolinate synthase [Deltaproteobacteria bacterium]
MLDLRGSMVALVTPMRNGAVDEGAFRSFVQWQLEQGTDGLVPCGTTGEGATLTLEETERVVRICVEVSHAHAKSLGPDVKHRPVIAGCGSNSTAKTLETIARAKAAGADAALVVTPYYNKPSQEGLYKHFEKVALEGGLPVVLYNVPSRTSVDMTADTVGRLSKVPGIVAIKEASGSIVRVAEIREKAEEKFIILAGDDMFTLPTLAMGGQGVISVVGNIAPADLALLCDAFADGNLSVAQNQQVRFAPLVRAMFAETNPMPVKYALSRMGKMSGELRLPLVPVSEELGHRIDAALRAYGIPGIH